MFTSNAGRLTREQSLSVWSVLNLRLHIKVLWYYRYNFVSFSIFLLLTYRRNTPEEWLRKSKALLSLFVTNILCRAKDEIESSPMNMWFMCNDSFHTETWLNHQSHNLAVSVSLCRLIPSNFVTQQKGILDTNMFCSIGHACILSEFDFSYIYEIPWF